MTFQFSTRNNYFHLLLLCSRNNYQIPDLSKLSLHRYTQEVIILCVILKHTCIGVSEFIVNCNKYLLTNQILIQLTVSCLQRFVLLIWLNDSLFLPNKQKELVPWFTVSSIIQFWIHCPKHEEKDFISFSFLLSSSSFKTLSLMQKAAW